MNPLFLSLAAGLAVINWISISLNMRILDILTLPALGITLLAWWLASQTGSWTFISVVVALAIFFSTVGDITLILPGDRILPGLVLFLVALLLYSIGFNLKPPPLNASSVLLALIPLALFSRLHPIIQKGLEIRGQTKLKTPALFYACGLTIFLFSCLGTLSNKDWPPASAIMAVLGGSLFYLSDVVLAWNRFVRQISKALLKNRMLYILGQIALVAGLVWKG